MKGVRFTAAGGSILVNGLVLAGLLTIAGPQAVKDLVRPVQVVLIPTPPEPPAVQPPPPAPAPAPPKPQPVQPQPRKPEKAPPPPQTRREPPPAAAPAPAPAPVVAARPVEENRPAAIAAEPAPPSAPVAPTVSAPPPAPAPAPVVRPEPRRVGPQVNGDWQGNTPPPYPMLAKRLGDSGKVTIDVQVAVDGRVTEVKLRRSSGSPLLDNAAIETVRGWRFSPATIDGQPVAAWYQGWTWTFKLDE